MLCRKLGREEEHRDRTGLHFPPVLETPRVHRASRERPALDERLEVEEVGPTAGGAGRGIVAK